MLSHRQSGRAWVRILIGAAIVVVVALVGTFIALSLVDWNKYADLAIAEVKQATGRELRIAGKIDVGLLPPRLIVDGVSLANAAWGSRPEMVKAKRVEIRAALLSLLIGTVRLKVDVTEPDVLLETNAKGVGNWVLARPAEKAKSDGPPESAGLPVSLDAARITKAVIRYRSARTGTTRRLALDEAYIRPAGRSGREILAKAALDGVPVSLSATTDDLLIDTLSVGESLGINLKAQTAGASFAANGRLGFPAAGPLLAMKVQAEVADTRPLAKIMGIHLPVLPPLKLDGEIKGGRKVYALHGLKVSMGKSAAAATIQADLSGARPKISGDISAPFIDLLEVLALQAPDAAPNTEGPKPTGRIFSDAPLPLAALNTVDADANLKIDRLALPPALLLEAVRGRVALDRGRLETRSLEMRAGGGGVKLVGALDASGASQAQFSANVAGQDIDLGKMMAALGRNDLITGGRTELKVELRSAGASPAALAAALDGHVRIVMGSARTKNRVLDRGMVVLTQVLDAVNPLRNKEPYTQIQCAVINVPVSKGLVTVDRTAAFETSHIGVAMAGTVNLASETLDLGIRPQAKEGVGVNVGGLANLVKLQGTLADPKVGVDVAGAAGAAAQIGIGVMTGGLSILAKGLFDRATMEAPCETALRGGQAPASGASRGGTSEQPATGGIGGFFDRLLK